jgi:hypothetical protein
MNGLSAQEIPTNSLTGNVIKNLTVSGSGAVTIGGALALTDVLTVSGGSLASGGNLTLKSSLARTARVTTVTTNAAVPIGGDVTVERYITARRAFRFLTAPVNTPGSIKANWMENTNNASTSENNDPVPGYGTHITGAGGAANGFDATVTNNPSLFTFDNINRVWIAATSTSGTLNVGKPYRILIRGNRSTNTNSNDAAPSITTVRAKGTLATGTIVMTKAGGGGTPNMPILSPTIDYYNLVGNPYASPIDWLLLEKVDIAGSIYIFDPTINGSNNRGGWVSWSSTGNQEPASLIDNFLQSGQSFFTQTTGANPSITFKETHKSGEHRAVFRPNDKVPRFSLQLLLPGQEVNGRSADAFSVYFSEDYLNEVGYEDSYKLTNQDENIGILRNGTLLSIEGRKPIIVNDTIPVKIWQLGQKKYFFRASIFNFDPTITTYLEDSFLKTAEQLKSNDVTTVPFTVTSDPRSSAPDRFRIVFETYVTLPVTFSSVKAYAKNKGVQVDWRTESESNMEKYEVERSTDAQTFAAIGTVNAALTGNNSSYYTWFDANPLSGENYYRIKSVSKSGEIKYSEVVRVSIAVDNKPMSIQAVATNANSIIVKLNNIEKGKYPVSLLNTAGQKIYSGNIYHQGGSANEVIKLNSVLAAGIYHLQLSNNDKIHNAQLIVP